MMTSKSVRIALAAAATLALAACAAPENRDPGTFGEANKTTGGTLLGAAAGGLLGSQIGGGSGKLIATGAGVLLGGLIGNQVGASLDRADVNYARQAEQRAHTAPLHQPIAWNNPESGHSGTITPTRDGTSADGKYCREYQQSVTVGGKTEHAFGTACRQPDGTWKVAN
jgi:surface antigen